MQVWKRRLCAVSLVMMGLVCFSRSEAKPAVIVESATVKVQETKAVVTNQTDKIKSACPDDMVEIQGSYCSSDDSKCLYWVDSYGHKTDIATDRCGEFSQPVHCLVPTQSMHYCIDKFEYPNKAGEIPQGWTSFEQAEQIATANGKRLCTSKEWSFAAMGPDNWQVAYGDGFHRDHSCNIDRHVAEIDITGDDVMKVADPNSEVAQKIRSLLVPSGSLPLCHSEFGVFDLDANMDEWVINESGRPYRSALMGGHQFGVRCNSRAKTLAHNEHFYWYESGFRECLSIPRDN